MLLTDLVPIVEVAKNIVISASALVAAYVALKGLKTWRDQEIWRSSNDLGQELLTATFQFRKVHDRLLNTIRSSGSQALLTKPLDKLSNIDKDYANFLVKRIDEELSVYDELRSKYEALFVRAVAMWSKKFDNDSGAEFLRASTNFVKPVFSFASLCNIVGSEVKNELELFLYIQKDCSTLLNDNEVRSDSLSRIQISSSNFIKAIIKKIEHTP